MKFCSITFGPFLEIGLLDRFFDLFDRGILRQHAGESEIAGLHDGVDPAAHAGIPCHGGGIDHVQLYLLLMSSCCTCRGSLSHTSSLLYGLLSKNVAPSLARIPAFPILSAKVELVAGNEIGFGDQIGSTDRFGSETQMRNCPAPDFLNRTQNNPAQTGRVLPDDLNGILVGAHGAIGA